MAKAKPKTFYIAWRRRPSALAKTDVRAASPDAAAKEAARWTWGDAGTFELSKVAPERSPAWGVYEANVPGVFGLRSFAVAKTAADAEAKLAAHEGETPADDPWTFDRGRWSRPNQWSGSGPGYVHPVSLRGRSREQYDKDILATLEKDLAAKGGAVEYDPRCMEGCRINPDPCPPAPKSMRSGYAATVRPAKDQDDRFDEAFDYVTSHRRCPMDPDDPEECDVECAREWAYDLMKSVGRPYKHKNPGRKPARKNPGKKAEPNPTTKKPAVRNRARGGFPIPTKSRSESWVQYHDRLSALAKDARDAGDTGASAALQSVAGGIALVHKSVRKNLRKGKKSGPGTYPWGQCMADNSSANDPAAVCGSIRAKSRKKYQSYWEARK